MNLSFSGRSGHPASTPDAATDHDGGTDGVAAGYSLPAAAIAARLVDCVDRARERLIHIAHDTPEAEAIADALRQYLPQVEVLLFPAWDCLPYDRVSPSPECMGKRIDALHRVGQNRDAKRRIVVMPIEAALVRVPPPDVVTRGFLDLVVGDRLDRDELRERMTRAGYFIDDRVDEPGEIALLGDVIDVFPAAANQPVRVILGSDDTILEIKPYDALTQRTEGELRRVVLGPASELIFETREEMEAFGRPERCMEDCLLSLYGAMPSIFDLVPSSAVSFAGEINGRLIQTLEFIAEARQARRDQSQTAPGSVGPYLTREDWDEALRDRDLLALTMRGIQSVPRFSRDPRPAKAAADFINAQSASGRKVVLAGTAGQLERLSVLRRQLGRKARKVVEWSQIAVAETGELLQAEFDLAAGFVDTVANCAVVSVADVTGTPKGEEARVGLDAALSAPEIRIGDVVLHEEHGLGVLRALETIEVDGLTRDIVKLEYHGGASLLVPVEEFGRIWRYGAEEDAVTLDRLNGDAWRSRRKKVVAQIKVVAKHLVAFAKRREEQQAPVIAPPHASYARFVARFPYAETADQTGAIGAVLNDLASGKTMNRLICGDVGFGKTEVALRAAAAVAFSGKQVAIVAPTTVLVRQHFETLKRRFAGTGIEVAHLSRVVGAAEAKRVRSQLKGGAARIVAATHAICGKSVEFADLGLLVIDEEQRFGAKIKEAMRTLAPGLHTLTMSATPIPRTLLQALVGVQEVSLLESPPARRRPVRTFLAPFDAGAARAALMREHRRGGQSFFVVPRIEDIDGVAARLCRLVPELTVKIAHGGMKAADLDEAMVRFAEGRGDILLATNIIESGLDLPRANTMLVWHADRFGLAQLHQLRGRVGRSHAQGFAYLLTEPGSEPAEGSRSRLSTLVAFDRLGAGLAISSRDLDLRGAGDLVGDEQAGHQKVLGVALYQQLLARAVARARGDQNRFRKPATIRAPITGAFPCSYIPDAGIRVNLYARLLRTSTADELDAFADEIDDRFGEPPPDVLLLFDAVRLAIAAASIGIEHKEWGPNAVAVSFRDKRAPGFLESVKTRQGFRRKAGRVIIEEPAPPGTDPLACLWNVVKSISRLAGFKIDEYQ